jgi:hypothetical protein
MSIRFILITIVLTRFYAEAQIIREPFILESKIHSGISIPLFDAIDYLTEDGIYTIDLSLSFPTYGDSYWEKLYNYPKTGFGFSVSSLGNREVLGNAWSVCKFISITVFEMKQSLALDYTASFGGAFIPHAFNLEHNYLNRAIGSRLNLFIRMGMDLRFHILKNSEIALGVALTHFSDGKTKSPNYGLNIASVSLGFNYFFNDRSLQVKDPEIPDIEKKYDQSVFISGGYKVYDNLNDVKYLTSSVTYNIERRLNQVSKIGLGSDFFYDASIREAIAGSDGTPEEDFVKQIRFGLHASYSARYKRTLFGIQIGYYLYSEYVVFTDVYNRLSLQYLITKNIIGCLSVKSHMGKADCLELGIGYTW